MTLALTWLLASAGLLGGAAAWRGLFGAARASGHAGGLEAALCMALGAAAPLWAAHAAAQGEAALHVLGTLWIWVALALALCDARVRRLPDGLTLALLGVALAYVWRDPFGDPSQALVAAAVASGAFWALHWIYLARTGRAGLGLGDVKLMAGLGAMLGLPLLPWVTLLAALAALLITLALVRLPGRSDPGRAGKILQIELPFGLYLCGAAIWLFGIM